MPGLLRRAARVAVVKNAVDSNRDRRAEQSAAQPAQAAAPVDHTNDQIAQLQQLAQLKDQGILTEAEFAAKKQQILGL